MTLRQSIKLARETTRQAIGATDREMRKDEAWKQIKRAMRKWRSKEWWRPLL